MSQRILILLEDSLVATFIFPSSIKRVISTLTFSSLISWWNALDKQWPHTRGPPHAAKVQSVFPKLHVQTWPLTSQHLGGYKK